MPLSDNDEEMPVPFGIDADTGQPLDAIDENTLRSLSDEGPEADTNHSHLAVKDDPGTTHFGTVGDVDPNNIEESGWAVLFSAAVTPAMKEALQPLLDHRKAQVKDERLYKVFEDGTGYQAKQTASAWLAARGVRMDVVDPLLGVPYFLLLVGPPDEIPFEFQYGLDIFWAIGRLWFETPEEYRNYATSVINYETSAAVHTARQMALFAPQHDFDRATQLFCKQVARPLVEAGDSTTPIGKRQKFAVQAYIGDGATKTQLRDIFRGAVPHGLPSLLLSGSHGMVFPSGDPRQKEMQGAIVCQDWEGYGAIEPSHWYAATDLPSEADLGGLIHVLFACYGGGCPQFDDFSRTEKTRKQIAATAMLSRLPQALLSHRGGGALAVLCHVERAWAYSFQSARGGPQVQGFRDVISRILRGDRLGQATDQFNVRWAALSTELADILGDIALNMDVPPQKLASMWVARDDARNYIIFGDPAVRLRVEDMPALA
jgi:hypothetical protein